MTHKEPVKKTARPGSTPGHRSSKAATRTASAGKDRVSDPSAGRPVWSRGIWSLHV